MICDELCPKLSLTHKPLPRLKLRMWCAKDTKNWMLNDGRFFMTVDRKVILSNK